MARKRGGLAGLYDRNKGLIRTGATIGASLLGGPLAGAATGAAFRGLDREGKRGIGFDIGQGLRGGLEGYAVGQGTQGVKALLTGAGKAAGAAAAGPLAPQPAVGATGGFFPGAGGAGVNPLAVAGKTTMEKAPSFLAKAGTFAKENKDLLTMAGKGIEKVLPNPASDAALMDAETARMRFDEERRQMQVEEERRRRIAELLMPLFRQQFPQYAGS